LRSISQGSTQRAIMRAIEITRPGGPEVLQEGERPMPRPGSGEVLVKVAASGVNRPDVFQRMGRYPPPPGASDLPGLEVSGALVEGDFSGDNPFQLKPGDAVCALLAGGGYAEYAAAPLGQCLPIPRGVSPMEAAALPETFFTVWSNVFDRAQLGRAAPAALAWQRFRWRTLWDMQFSPPRAATRNAAPAKRWARARSIIRLRILWSE
jgi:NADPH2:quinone reductase